MKNQKKIIIPILFFVLLCVFVFPVSAMSDGNENCMKWSEDSFTKEEIDSVYEFLESTENLPDVVINAPYTYSLVMANESRKKAVLESIQFMPIEDSEKNQMTETIQDIWKRTPDNISEDDYESLKKIGDSVIKYNMMGYATSSISTQYSVPKAETPEEQKYRIQKELDEFKIEGLTVEHVVEMENRINARKNLPEVVQNAPYRALLLADKEARDGYLKHIDNMSISPSEKERMKNDLIDLWNRSPDAITTDDYPRIEEIGSAIKEYVDETFFRKQLSEKNNTPAPKWYGSTHGDLIYYACIKVLNNSTFANNAKNHADDPDDPGFEQYIYGIGVYYPDIARLYNHYYNSNILLVFLFGHGYGGAAGKCSEYTNDSLNYYSIGQKSASATYLGYGSHYLSDVGNPMHTGISEQWKDADDYIRKTFSNSGHVRYEDYVDGNWSTGYNYKSIVSNNTYSIYIDDPEQAVIDLSNESNSYLDTLCNAIYSNPQSFGSNVDVRFITSHMIRKTARYNLGLVQYISTTNRTPKITYISENCVFANQTFTTNYTVISPHPIYEGFVFYRWSDGIGNLYVPNSTYSADGSMILQDVTFEINIDFDTNPRENLRELAQYIADDEYESSYDINEDGSLTLLDLFLLNRYINEHY